MAGVPFLGFIDVETKSTVFDYKVTKAAKSQSETDNDLQLTIYSYGTGKENVGFYSLTKTKTCNIDLKMAIRKEKDYAVAEAVIDGAVDGIKKGVFPMCDPTKTFPCSPKWCGFYRMCRGSF